MRKKRRIGEEDGNTLEKIRKEAEEEEVANRKSMAKRRKKSCGQRRKDSALVSVLCDMTFI